MYHTTKINSVTNVFGWEDGISIPVIAQSDLSGQEIPALVVCFGETNVHECWSVCGLESRGS